MHGPTVPGLLRSTSLRRPGQAPRVSTPAPATGLLRRGNRNHIDTAPSEATLACFAEPISARGQAPSLDRSGWRTADEKLRRGGVCPGCGIERPLSGDCNSCW